jgi:D-alanine-D-alanine ligase
MHSCDIIFNALHGGIGENGEVQKWMEQYNIRYTGSGSKPSSICMDKSKTKIIATGIGIKTPDWKVINSNYNNISYDMPFVVKPNSGGSTFGLTIVEEEADLKRAFSKAFQNNDGVIIEKYIKGRELTVTILDSKAYPIIEIKPSHKIYDFECKYTDGLTEYICPASIENSLALKIMRDSERLFKVLGCKVYSRADYILDKKGDCYFLEMNTLPGMTPTSLTPKSVKETGMSFEKLIESIIIFSLKCR